jgi:hypothetical protein
LGRQKRIKISLIQIKTNWDNTCYFPIQNFSSSRLLSKSLSTEIYKKPTILHFILHDFQISNWFLVTLYRLRVSENRVEKRDSKPVGKKWNTAYWSLF